MTKIEKFDDFESAVVDKVKNKIGYGSILGDATTMGTIVSGVGSAIGGVLGCIWGGPFGAIAGLGHSSLGLNEYMYKSYLKVTYQQRFEAHKNDSKYISNLIEEAADEMIKLNT